MATRRTPYAIEQMATTISAICERSNIPGAGVLAYSCLLESEPLPYWKSEMKNKLPAAELNGRIAREVEREQSERARNDEAKTGFGADEEYRVKDARETSNSSTLRRPS